MRFIGASISRLLSSLGTYVHPDSGWYDPLLQNEAYVTFATNAPGYGQLQSDEVLAALNESFFGPGGCQEQEMACYAARESDGSDAICRQADNFCVSATFCCDMTVPTLKRPGRECLYSSCRGS